MTVNTSTTTIKNAADGLVGVDLTIRSLGMTLHDGDALGLAQTLQDVINSAAEEDAVHAWVGIPHGFIAVTRRTESADDIELVSDGGVVLATLSADECLDAVRVIRGYYF
ncbi:hypothetical protein SAMN06295974_3779 [Plantibacter flavus]|uniref:Uncharacterized protein n=1 Tax=Plantibacter flavus TaxID=150123 RepID=A0A3N2BLC1_9MICO|nr:hypothetical protein [Plantibacter flavus]ROR76073.1 hypothetical protein EDD42_4026 [Plantibacter flavus]SMG48883.1 hypothetical protein SAMN06295974_3779 [Plantibacter flavus]